MLTASLNLHVKEFQKNPKKKCYCMYLTLVIISDCLNREIKNLKDYDFTVLNNSPISLKLLGDGKERETS